MGLLARYRRAWVAVFVGLLWVPMLGQAVTTGEAISTPEARNLRKRPDLPTSAQAWSSFPHAVDGFLADHFGFREQLTRANARLRYELSSPTSPWVLIGRDRFLFYLGNDAVQQSMGILIRKKQLAKLVDVVAGLHDELAKRNIKFLFTSPPNNSTINRAHLPRWAAKVPSATEYDLVLPMLASRGVPVLDLRPALESENARNPTYSRTDTHWNVLGALIARNEIVSALGHPDWLIDVAHVLRGYYETIEAGDLAGLLGIDTYVHDQRLKIDVSSYPGVASPTLLVVGDSFVGLLPAIWGNGARLAIVNDVIPCEATIGMILAHEPSIVVFAPNERYLGICE